jgi:hypothetical protein
MKFYTVLASVLALIGSLECQAAPGGGFWRYHFHSSKSIAKDRNLPLFIYFTASDREPCTKSQEMDANILSMPEFCQALAGKMIFVKLDDHLYQYPENRLLYAELRREYGIQVYPSVMILDPSGNRITKIPLGYKDLREDPRYKGLSMSGAYAQMVSDLISDYNKEKPL